MKKFWMISMLLIAALFVISCGDGGEEEGGAGDACTEQGALRCSGDMVQKCDQETWKNFENCADAGKTCNAGKCEAQGGDNTDTGNDNTDTGNDNTDTGSDNTDTGNDNTDTGSQGGDTCIDIYECYNGCQDQACVQACVDQGSATAQSQFVTMYNCWYDNCQGAEDFTSCVSENCSAETEACGLALIKPGDETYPSPYGTAQINLSSNYILAQGEQAQAQNQITLGSFISGSFGTSGTLTPAAQQSYYQTSLVTQQGMTQFQTFQVNALSQSNIAEPVIILATDASASAGTALYDVTDQDSVGMLIVASQIGTDAEGYITFGCYDALGAGELTITNIVAQTGSAGALEITGTINLYSPANYPNYGDITSVLGVAACPVK